MEVVPVIENDQNTVSVFLTLGRDYLKGLPCEEREKFLQSILRRQREPDRWLLLLRHQGEYGGFAHVKIDKDERPGWGFILEYYIIPIKRRIGLGTAFFKLIADLLQARGVENIWLLTHSSTAEQFWRSLGFRLTGETDKETGHNIMAKSLNPVA